MAAATRLSRRWRAGAERHHLGTCAPAAIASGPIHPGASPWPSHPLDNVDSHGSTRRRGQRPPPALSPVAGRVIGTEPATPLEFWVGRRRGHATCSSTTSSWSTACCPTGSRCASPASCRRCGPATRAPASTATCSSSPTASCPPRSARPRRCWPPGSSPRSSCRRCRARRCARPRAPSATRPCCSRQMRKLLPAGLSRDDEPFYLNLEFLDGTRGAHVNISGISGVATKTTYATFLLYSLFHSGVLGAEAANTKALIFNVKGEDLLFLDHPNVDLERRPAGPLRPPRPAGGAVRVGGVLRPAGPRRPQRQPRRRRPPAATSRRSSGPSRSSAAQELLPFLFADAEDERQQYTMVVHNVAARLRHAEPVGDGAVNIDGQVVRTFDDLVELIEIKVDLDGPDQWGGRAIGAGTINAFVRRLHGARSPPAPPRPGRRRPARRPPGRLRPGPGHGRRPAQPQRPGQAVRGRRRAAPGVRAQGALGPGPPAAVRRARRAQQVRAARRVEPDQGDPARRRRAGPLARHHPHRRPADGQRGRAAHRRQLGDPGRRAGSTPPRRAGASTASCPPVQRQRATIVKPGTMIVSQPELPDPARRAVPVPGLGHPRARRVDAGRRPGPATPTGTPATAPAGERPSVRADDPFAGFPTGYGRCAVRLLHTSDWHVGKAIRGRSRADEHRAVLAEIAGVAEREAVDLVIVAGDLFDTAAPTPESERIVYRALLDLAAGGRPVVVVAGNHDSAAAAGGGGAAVAGQRHHAWPRPSARRATAACSRSRPAARRPRWRCCRSCRSATS